MVCLNDATGSVSTVGSVTGQPPEGVRGEWTWAGQVNGKCERDKGRDGRESEV